MATVVHHKPDKPWLEAFSNALWQGTQNVAQQRMERDKLAVQISENAKQRAAEAFLTGMRIRGRYQNAEMQTDAMKEQNSITNDLQRRRVEAIESGVTIEKNKVLQLNRNNSSI